MILDTGLNYTYEDKSEEIKNILEIKSSNRDNTKYLVYAKGSKDPISKKPSPKSLASLYIFRAWLENPDGEATLDGIRKAFPVEKFTNSEKYPYKYIFYRKKDIETALKNDKVEGKTYYRTMLGGDDKECNKYLTWDFFIDDDDKHCLKIQGEDVLSIKMWLKEEFDELVKHARDKGIVIEEKSK